MESLGLTEYRNQEDVAEKLETSRRILLIIHSLEV